MFSRIPGSSVYKKKRNIIDNSKTILIRKCQTPKFVEKVTSDPNGSGQGVIVEVEYIDTCNCSNVCKKSLAIETLDGLMLVPVNANTFCLNQGGKRVGQLVSLEYEDVSHAYNSPFGIPVRIIKLLNYNPLVRTATGIVEQKDGYVRLLDTSADIEVSLIIEYVMGLNSVQDLIGSTIDITYVDVGVESSDRCGIPITILEYS